MTSWAQGEECGRRKAYEPAVGVLKETLAPPPPPETSSYVMRELD